MSRHHLSSKEKLEIVLEGMRSDVSMTEVCNRHGNSQTAYYKWRDKLLASCDTIFAAGGINRSEERLKAENQKLRTIIGDLTVE